MALTDTASFAALSRLGADWELLTHTVDGPEIGWDVWTGTFIKDFGASAVEAAAVAASWPIGRRPVAGLDFWTVKRAPQRVGGNVWKLNVTAHGDLGGRPLKARVRSSTSVTSRENVSVGPPLWPGVITVATANLKESSPALEVSYILRGPPPTNKLGVNGWDQVVPVAVPLPEFIWTHLSKFAFNFPVGWSRDDLDADTLPGADTEIHLVTEVWNHKPMISPN